jgi:polysaccharide chain length determinant protein (PEP-CTERM system associated)
MESPRKELGKYLAMVVKRRYLFVIVALAIMSVFAWGGYLLPTKYEAKSTIFIEKTVIGELVKGIAISPSIEDKVRVLRYALLSRGLILRVMKDMDLDVKAKTPKQQELMIEDFQKRTEISVKGNDLFIVSMRDKDPRLATNYVNALVRRYLEENVSAKREESYGANRFLAEQLALFKEKLNKADEQVIMFRQKQGVAVAMDEEGIVGEIKVYKAQMDEARMRRNELASTLRTVKVQMRSVQPTVSILSTKGGGGSVQALENRIKMLLVSYTENYPEIVKLRAEIEAIKKQNKAPAAGVASEEMTTVNPVYQQLEQAALQTEAEIQALNAKIGQLGGLIAERERELRDVPANKKRLADLEQERSTYKNMYAELQARAGVSEVSKQMEVEDKSASFRIVDPAVVPVKPVSPDRVKLILAGIFLGIVGGFGGVLLREALDSSIKDLHALKGLGVTILAVIPKMTNAAEELETQRRDRKVFIAAGCYFMVICLLLVHEILKLTYVDHIFSFLQL